ncbi:MAG: crossover junction endodeoxyribonuclease RuvC [Ignavibacteria bacterium]|nr:crossover junction endodeoxyribonuclease RuvC [Ignavibacteria bacterium]
MSESISKKKNTPKVVRVLGIDPGSVVCGYGVIDVRGSHLTLVEYGAIAVKKYKADFPKRLLEIHQRLQAVIARTKPDECALEKVFYAKNVVSVVQLSHARGVAVLACAEANLSPMEYTPMQVKRSVTGRGTANKEQVQHMVRALLQIDETHKFFDATDALAVAICHAVNGKPPTPIIADRKKKPTWKDFVESNPSRVLK